MIKRLIGNVAVALVAWGILFAASLSIPGLFPVPLQAAGSVSSEVFTGAIMLWGGDHVATSSLYEPKPGWFLCNGAIASTAVYPLLYKDLGTKYKRPGDPADSFRVPDPQGAYFKIFGTNNVLGANYANASGTPKLDSTYMALNFTDPGHQHYLWSPGASLYIRAFSWTAPSVGSGEGYQAAGSGDIAVALSGTTGISASLTQRSGTVTEPANVGVCALIKF